MTTPPVSSGAGLGDDPSFEAIYQSLSTPMGRGGMSRRRFLQGLVAAGTIGALGPGVARAADAMAPLGPSDPIVIAIMFGGGNDGLNTVIPVDDPAYRQLRPNLSAAATGAHRLGTTGLALHPALGRLATRYAQNKVAVIRGVGNPTSDHSHFTSMATWMAGTKSTSKATGWLGRYLDTIGDSPEGLRGVVLDSSVPLHMVGARSQVTAMSGTDTPFGAVRTKSYDNAMFDAVRAFGANGSGLGKWGDAVGAMNKAAIDRARLVSPLFGADVELPAGELAGQLDIAARLINANLGTKVIGATFGSFDTHTSQLYTHNARLADFDAAIAGFYAKLAPQWADQVVFVTFSEFGRRASENQSGTDHGTASTMFVIGDRVRGGMYGTQPSLTALDNRGDLAVHVDFRKVYASVLGGWMGVDPAPILGADFGDLGLFASRPSATAPVPPPVVPDPRWAPFPSVQALVTQQYADHLNKVGTPAWVTTWSTRLTSGQYKLPAVLNEFFVGSDLYRFGVDASRVALLGTGTPARHHDLLRWTAMLKAGGKMRTVAAEVVASQAFRDRYGRLSNRPLIDRVHRDIIGAPAPKVWLDQWMTKFGQGQTTVDMFLATAMSNTAKKRHRNLAVVPTVYAAMLRRAPDAGNNKTWADRMTKGSTLPAVLAEFFKTPEYARRFR